MKNTHRYFIAFAAAALVLACGKEEVRISDESSLAGQKETPSADQSEKYSDHVLKSFSAVLEKAVSIEGRASLDLSAGVMSVTDGDSVLVTTPAGASGIYVFSTESSNFVPLDDNNAISMGSEYARVFYPARYFSAAEGNVTFTMPAAGYRDCQGCSA